MDARTLRKSQFSDGTYELQFFGEGLFGLKKQEGGSSWTWRGKYTMDQGGRTLILLPSHLATPELQKSKKLKNKGEEKWKLHANEEVSQWSGVIAGSNVQLTRKEKPHGNEDDDDLGF